MENDIVVRLTLEIHRILCSPYEVCLKRLHDILIYTNHQQLHDWARSNPCQIDGLAVAVLDALEHRPFALDILQILSYVSPFRDSVLEQKPTLLKTLLSNALASAQAFDQYAAVCTALLSAPLDVPDPAILPDFLSKLFDKANQSPSISTIRPIYVLLSSIASNLLDVLPVNILTGLQDRLIEMLRGVEVDEHSTNLICLAILAKLTSVSSTNSKLSKDLSQPSLNLPLLETALSDNGAVSKSSRNYSLAQQFFSAERALKTLDLVVLKVILACSRSCTLLSKDVVESLKYSEEIVNAVTKDEKKNWLSRNGIKCRKLSEKISRHDIDPEIRHAAINFTTSLSEGQPIPFELRRFFDDTLKHSTALALSQKTLERYFIQSDDPSIGICLLELLEIACSESNPSKHSLLILEKAARFVSSLVAGVQTSGKLRKSILSALSTDRLSRPLHLFLGLRLPLVFPSTHHGSFPCPYSFFRARLDLCKNICALFLRASQHALGDEINLDPSVSTALFDIYSDRLQAVHAKCSYYTSTPTPLSKNLVYLFDTRRSPSINLTSRSWRDKLLDEMSKTTEHQHELAVKALGDVCHDLEIRCEVAERPFLEAQTRSHDLDEKLKRAGMKHAELKSQAEDQTLMMNELKTENDHLVEQIKSAEQRYQTLLDSYGTLQAEIDQSTVKTAEAINIAHESAEQKELAHLAIITGKDEVFEAQSFKLADAEAHVASLSDEAVQMRLKISTNNEEIRCLQESLDEKERGSEKDKRTLASLLIEIEHRINHEANLETENRDMISRLEESDKLCSELRSEGLAKAAAYEDEVATLQLEFNTKLSEKDVAALQQSELHNVKTKQLQHDLDNAAEKIVSTVRQSEMSLAEAEKKIKNLCRERDERVKEFAEVQDLSTKLMAVMELKQTRTVFAPRSDGQKNSLSTTSVHDKRLLDVSPTQSAQSLESSTFSANGPIMRRPKPQRSSNSSSESHAQMSLEMTLKKETRESKSKNKRYPLEDLQVVTQLSPSKRNRRKQGYVNEEGRHNFGLDENSNFFCSSDIFTNPSPDYLDGRHEKMTTTTDDDTTMEF